MKQYYIFRLALVFFLTFTSVTCSYGFASSLAISIDQEAGALVGPDACRYQWYQNDKLLEGQTHRNLKVTEGGNYSVKAFDEKGNVVETEITVALSATGAIIKIILIGDSTVANAPANLYPNMGWGQVFQYYFNSANIQVMNFAKSGTSTTTFYSGYWPAAKKAIAAGDYVFMQFGHNDQKENLPVQYAAPFGKYQDYLTKYANEIKALGAIPIFVTSVNRNIWSGTRLDSTSLGSYPTAVRQLGKKLNIPVIDLHDKSATLYMQLGQTYLSNYVFNNYQAGEYPNYPNGNADKTHFNEMGAIEISRLVIQCIKELGAKNNSLKALVPFLNPVYEVEVAANPKASASMNTRTASYPKGMKITLKTTPKTSSTKFQYWADGAGKSVSNKLIYSFSMGDKPTSFTAIYPGGVVTDIEDHTTSDEFGSYPNPFTNELQLYVKGNFEYSILDMEGLEVETGKAENVVTVGGVLKAGVYVCKVQSDQGTRYMKVVKQ